MIFYKHSLMHWTASGDFRPLFFHQISSSGPMRGSLYSNFEFCRISAEIFEYEIDTAVKDTLLQFLDSLKGVSHEF